MSLSLRHLDIIRRDTEVRRDDVADLRRKLHRKMENAKTGVLKKQQHLQSLQSQILDKRHEMPRGEFLALLNLAKKKKKSSTKAEKALHGLDVHSQKLGRLFGFYRKKLEIVEQKEQRAQNALTHQQSEIEGEQLTEYALYRLQHQNEAEEIVSTDAEENGNEFGGDERVSYELPTKLEHRLPNSPSPQDAPFGGAPQGESHQHTPSHHSENPDSSPSENGSSSHGAQFEIQDGTPAEHWSDGEEHHLHFSFAISERESVRIQVERRVENRLSLAILGDPKQAIQLQAVKAKLSTTLQQSGFILESLRILPFTQGGFS